MSKLSKFLGQSKDIVIRGETIKLFPLTVQEMGILDRMDELGKKDPTTLTPEEKEELAKCGRELLKAAYKEEKLTDEEIKQMDLDMYSDLFAAVMEDTYQMKDGTGLARIRELKEKVISEGKAKA